MLINSKGFLLYVVLLVQIVSSPGSQGGNFTAWRQHRRHKRFLIYQNSGVVKLVTGITFSVDLNDKKPWRQMVWTMNLHYQFGVPTAASDWTNKWNHRKLNQGFEKPSFGKPSDEPLVDIPQSLLYGWFVELLNQRGANGKQCLLKLICENAQVDYHAGLWSEILHRVLRPHKSLDESYKDAMALGEHGLDCDRNFPAAVGCLVDDYLPTHHIHPKHTLVSLK